MRRSSGLDGIRGKRILFLNWRCPWHPLAGGSEEYCWRQARWLTEAGASVTLFAALADGLPPDEKRQGIRVLRRGGTFTVYLFAGIFLLRHRQSFDVVIDVQNGIPFFAPLFLLNRSTAVVPVIHHVHQDQFSLHFRWPLAWMGRILESHVARLVYGSRPVVALSPSTRAEVRRRLNPRGSIFIVPPGVGTELQAAGNPASDPFPRIVFVGRLVTQKRLELLLRALRELGQDWPLLQLDIAGSGPMEQQWSELAQRLGVAARVRFWGHVTEGERTTLLARSWLLVTPSAHEGWGLTVVEANQAGRPALGIRGPGLVDCIVPGFNGWLADGPEHLTESIHTALRQLRTEEVRAEFAIRCQSWARRFSWPRSGERLSDVINDELRQVGRRDPANDVVTAVTLELDAIVPGALSLLPARHPWELTGRSLRILLYGKDTFEAVEYLTAKGLSGKATVRVASSRDLLVAPAWEDAEVQW